MCGEGAPAELVYAPPPPDSGAYLEVLVGKLSAVDGLAAGPVEIREVAALFTDIHMPRQQMFHVCNLAFCPWLSTHPAPLTWHMKPGMMR